MVTHAHTKTLLRAVPLQSVESKLCWTGESEMAEREASPRLLVFYFRSPGSISSLAWPILRDCSQCNRSSTLRVRLKTLCWWIEVTFSENENSLEEHRPRAVPQDSHASEDWLKRDCSQSILRPNPWLPFFSLDWQFSTWSTWCANYSFIRLRKVVFFCAQKSLIFDRHYDAMFVRPGYQEHKTIALWRNFLNTVHTTWKISWKNPAQTTFPFLPLRCFLV